MRRTKINLALATLAFCAGCQSILPPQPGDPAFAPSKPIEYHSKKSSNGAIFNPHTSMVLFETPRARNVGDILTIRLIERTDAQKRARTVQRKNEEMTMPNPTVFGKPVDFGNGYNLKFDVDSQRNFTGEGESRQNNRLEGSISVTVREVLGNGNMLVVGEKWVKINQGQEYIRLTGLVRPQDIAPDNSVTSDRVANARIAYSGTGQVNSSNAQGWFSRFLWSMIFPF